MSNKLSNQYRTTQHGTAACILPITPLQQSIAAKPVSIGVRGFAALKAVLQLKRDPLAAMKQLADTYGPVVRLQFGSRTLFLVSCPDVARHVLQRNHANYRKAKRRKRMDIAIANSLFTTDGAFWHKRRKVLQQAFKTQMIRDYIPNLWRQCEQMLHLSLGDTGNDQPYSGNMSSLMENMTMSASLVSLFGQAKISDTNTLVTAVKTCLQFMQQRVKKIIPLPVSLPSRRNKQFLNDIAYVRTTISDIVRQSHTKAAIGPLPKSDTNTIVHLVQTIGEDSFDTKTTTNEREQYLVNELTGFMAASFDTVSSALMWFWHLIGQHPDCMRRIRAELAEYIQPGQTPTAKQLDQCQYLENTLHESMRLYAPTWVERQATAPDNVNGYRIPKNAMVVVSPYLLHRNTAHWEAPEVFDPSRFERKSISERKRFSFLPYGGGPHICIGARFSMTMMKVIVATILQSRSYTESAISQEIPIHPVSQISIRPSRPVFGNLILRPMQ